MRLSAAAGGESRYTRQRCIPGCDGMHRFSRQRQGLHGPGPEITLSQARQRCRTRLYRAGLLQSFAFSLACSMVMQVSDVVALHSKSLVVPAHPDSVRRLASVSATGTVLFICGSFTWGYCESAFGINWLWLSLPSWLSIWSVLNPFMPPCGTDGGGTGLRSSPSALLLSFSCASSSMVFS